MIRLGLAAVLVAAGMGELARADDWTSFGENAQHTALSPGPSQIPQQVRWSTKVDLKPQYSGGALYIHYGSPVISSVNNVFVPQKTQAAGGFVVNAFRGATGEMFWTMATDYQLPAHNWVPSMGITLTPDAKELAVPGAGGTVLLRTSPNARQGTIIRMAFYGIKNYEANPTAFNNAIQICTPILADAQHTLYFGYTSSGAALPGYPSGIPGGLARVPIKGEGSFVAASTLANDKNIKKPAFNCAPALTTDRGSLYIAVNVENFSYGYLCKVNAATLAPEGSILLKDPRNSSWNALVPDDGTASPTIGPDGDVYYGVLEADFPSNHARGWMLHFNADLTTVKTPGAFGWDNTAAIVPAALVPSYTGSSNYLVLTKYNNYADPGIGGNGQNMVAILDPGATMVDPVTGATVMNEVITVLGPTKNPNLPGVDEWCINSVAVDAANSCAVVNSEDGHVYRWDFSTNTLSPGLQLAPPTGEAYTPTLIGPDGAVYAINNAQLNCCIAIPTSSGVHRLSDSTPGSAGASPGPRSAAAGSQLGPATLALYLVAGSGLLAALSFQFANCFFRRSRVASESFLSG